MFIEPTITSGFSGYIWLDTKIVLKKVSVYINDNKKWLNCGIFAL